MLGFGGSAQPTRLTCLHSQEFLGLSLIINDLHLLGQEGPSDQYLMTSFRTRHRLQQERVIQCQQAARVALARLAFLAIGDALLAAGGTRSWGRRSGSPEPRHPSRSGRRALAESDRLADVLPPGLLRAVSGVVPLLAGRMPSVVAALRGSWPRPLPFAAALHPAQGRGPWEPGTMKKPAAPWGLGERENPGSLGVPCPSALSSGGRLRRPVPLSGLCHRPRG